MNRYIALGIVLAVVSLTVVGREAWVWHSCWAFGHSWGYCVQAMSR